MRSKIACIARAPDFPYAMMMPAMTNEHRNISKLPPSAATIAQRLGRQLADLGLHALDESRQIVVRLRPDGMHLLADDRPCGIFSDGAGI